jgi:type IV pilus assembly protein PilX
MSRDRSFSGSPRRQEGIVLIVAIIAIVAMSFAVYAMLRTTTGSQGIAGNLAFKKNATSAADMGMEAARIWLLPPQTVNTLAADQPTSGYFSTWDRNFDPFTYPWNPGTNAVEVTANDGAGNRVMYVIHRLCAITGSFTLPNQECVRPSANDNRGGTGTPRSGGAVSGGSGGTIGGGGSGTVLGTSTASAASYFRITTRVEGPRNTLSYTQVIMF